MIIYFNCGHHRYTNYATGSSIAIIISSIIWIIRNPMWFLKEILAITDSLKEILFNSLRKSFILLIPLRGFYVFP